MSSELDAAPRAGAVDDSAAARGPRPGGSPSGDGLRGVRARLGGVVRGLARRDVLGVNAVVLALLLIPLGFGIYARVHWDGKMFAPDSRYYVTMTLRDMGYSVSKALGVQLKTTHVPAEAWYFAHSDPDWLVVQPRMLFPFLSAPFVGLLGPRAGMTVVPIVAVLVTVTASARLTQRLYGPFAALAAAGTLAAASTLANLTMALTDALAMALFALVLLNLPIGRRAQGHNLVWLGILSVLLCLTRQTMPIAAGMVCCAWLWALVFPAAGRPRRIRNEWLWPAVIVAGVTMAGQEIDALFATYNSGQLFQLGSLPNAAWTITRAEVLGMVQNDRFLLVLMAAPLVHVLVRFKDVTTGLFLGALVGTYAVIIAVEVPSQMRYESVLFPIAVVCFGALVHRFVPEPLRGGSVADDGVVDSGAAPRPTWWQGSPRRVPALAGAGALGIVGIIAWSATHGSASVAGLIPTSPSAAAALTGTEGLAVPNRTVPAWQILHDGIQEAAATSRGRGTGRLVLYLDWRHPLKYTPAAPGDPGWSTRAADGSAVIRFGDYVELAPVQAADGLSRSGTVDADSLKILSDTASGYGEDVTFQIKDTTGIVHTGRATVLYPLRPLAPGLITELVYES